MSVTVGSSNQGAIGLSETFSSSLSSALAFIVIGPPIEPQDDGWTTALQEASISLAAPEDASSYFYPSIGVSKAGFCEQMKP
jgi:hypothetical protein